jgi:hypothetical protein
MGASLYDQFHTNVKGIGPLSESSAALTNQSLAYESVRDNLTQALSGIKATYTGNAANAMTDAFQPVIDSFNDGANSAGSASAACDFQSGSFSTAQSNITKNVAVPDAPWYESVDPWNTDHDNAVNQNSQIDSANEAAYNTYGSDTTSNVKFVESAAPDNSGFGNFAVQQQGPGSTVGSSSGAPSAGGSGSSGGSYGGSRGGSGAGRGSGSYSTGPSGNSGPGGSGTSVPPNSPSSSTSTAGFPGTNPGGTNQGGYPGGNYPGGSNPGGPGGGSPGGGQFNGNGPGGMGPMGGVGGYSGGGAGSGGASGLGRGGFGSGAGGESGSGSNAGSGGRSGAGALGAGEEGELGGPGGAAGARSGAGMGGMGRGGGRGGRDEEHKTAGYLVNDENGSMIVGDFDPVAPPVIGE